ncbi:MAG TPA: TonB-dependent receptor plug domain-containing protein [Acidobacteriaceae bacterium]|jgi:outer membrane receptor for Fe3+-dicitrate|nr:TonB-dependent receptor plug domain-containing protein [Acidobacteriaceae bacterium]
MKKPSTPVLSVGTLALLLMLASGASAQLRGTVTNARGAPIAGATITDMAGHRLAVSGADGGFALAHPAEQVEVTAAHYVVAVVTIVRGEGLRVVLHQPLETVVVTAYRSAVGSSDSAASTRVMNGQQLQRAAPPSLDGKLREIPGFELYRRSSSLVANPTTEGISLRGLGSTAASRSLVVLDDVPLNDPYGGWIHWEELPELAVQSVEIVRGGRRTYTVRARLVVSSA